jgi:hypothetical protein
MDNDGVLYDDGRIACDETALTVRWYYPWGARKIPYASIRTVEKRPLRPVRGRWRLWGSGDFRHWYNLDFGRTKKEVALELHTGGRIVPTITPDDPDAVERILSERLGR